MLPAAPIVTDPCTANDGLTSAGVEPNTIDSVVVLRPTRHKIGHLGDVSPS